MLVSGSAGGAWAKTCHVGDDAPLFSGSDSTKQGASPYRTEDYGKSRLWACMSEHQKQWKIAHIIGRNSSGVNSGWWAWEGDADSQPFHGVSTISSKGSPEPWTQNDISEAPVYHPQNAISCATKMHDANGKSHNLYHRHIDLEGRVRRVYGRDVDVQHCPDWQPLALAAGPNHKAIWILSPVLTPPGQTKAHKGKMPPRNSRTQ